MKYVRAKNSGDAMATARGFQYLSVWSMALATVAILYCVAHDWTHEGWWGPIIGGMVGALAWASMRFQFLASMHLITCAFRVMQEVQEGEK